MKSGFCRSIQIFKKLFSGKLLFIEQDKHSWNNQYKKGKWDFLLDIEKQPHILFIAKTVTDFFKKNSHSVLDVGCGNGILLRSLKDMGSYTGVDISEVAISNLKKEFPRAHFLIDDIQNSLREIQGQRFDSIIFSEVLYYVNYKKLIPMYKQYTHQDSKIIISLYQSWRSFFIWRAVKKHCVIETVNYFERQDKKVKWKVAICHYKP